MEKTDIIELITSIDPNDDISSLESALQNRYDISAGRYDVPEIIRAIFDKLPVIVSGHIVIGYDPISRKFIDSDNTYFSIERPVSAIIVSSKKFADSDVALDFAYPVPAVAGAAEFAIMGADEWGGGNDLFFKHIEPLRINEVFLPSHSAVFNFINPTEKTKKDNVVSMLNGANINIYEKDRYFENILHEIGHLFWRTKVTPDEKAQFESMFKNVVPTALIEFPWEKENAEEYFCTIYKWYLRSLFIHKSFMNILAHEDPKGLQFMKGVFSRISENTMKEDTFELSKPDIDDFFNPKFDKTTGSFIRKKGLLDRVREIEVPESVMTDIDGMRDGVMFVNLSKASKCVPVENGRIITNMPTAGFTGMMKGRSLTDGKKIIFLDMDGVVAGFTEAYKNIFNRDARKDDQFTVQQQCLTQPHFFRNLPVIDKGRELVKLLSEKYTVSFLTSPMDGMTYCRQDKIAWCRKNFPDVKTVLFSQHKEEYAGSDHAVLVDDMAYQRDPFNAAGGTAIDSALDNKKIVALVDAAFEQKEDVKAVEAQLKKMDVDLFPSPEQKESGNYKKGEIVFKGIKIKIENPKGSVRFGFDSTGTKWMNRMKSHYGYIHNGPEGNDGDKIDCFIGDKFNGNKVFIVNQKGASGLFDEHKVMLCFDSVEDARAGYLANYQKGWDGIMSITATNTKKLRDWLETGNKTEPF